MLELYKNIKRFRKELGMSQDKLAQLTGYTDRSSIAKIEKGEVDIPQSKIILFADALNVDPGIYERMSKASSQLIPRAFESALIPQSPTLFLPTGFEL